MRRRESGDAASSPLVTIEVGKVVCGWLNLRCESECGWAGVVDSGQRPVVLGCCRAVWDWRMKYTVRFVRIRVMYVRGWVSCHFHPQLVPPPLLLNASTIWPGLVVCPTFWTLGTLECTTSTSGCDVLLPTRGIDYLSISFVCRVWYAMHGAHVELESELQPTMQMHDASFQLNTIAC